MSDGIHTSVEAMQSPARQALLNRPPSHAQSEQLPPGNDPMLPVGQVRKDSISATKGAFSPYSVVNALLVADGSPLESLGHQTMVAGTSARVARRMSNLFDGCEKKRLQPGGTAPGFDPLK